MISTSGLPATLALNLIKTKHETFTKSITSDSINKREINAFNERIGNITTAEDLVNDYETFSFVMKAFDLEDQIFGKAMMKKVLSSDATDKKSLLNKLTDNRFKELYTAMGFTAGVKEDDSFTDPDWVQSIVDRYVDQKLINAQLDDNSSVGHVLHFQQKVENGNIKNWYSVLADTTLKEFFMTSFGLPDAFSNTDIDAQARLLEKKFDLEKLSDPAEIEKLTKRYLALSDDSSSTTASSNPIVQLVSGGTSSSIISINMDGFRQLKTGKY